MKQLNTWLVQMHGPGTLGSCIEAQLLGFIKVIAVRCMHKEVHRAAFQGMHQQQGVLYQAYAATLKAKPELCQYRMVAPVCKGDLCNCSGHKQLLYYRDGGDPAGGRGIQQGPPGSRHGGMVCTEGLDTIRAIGFQVECWRI